MELALRGGESLLGGGPELPVLSSGAGCAGAVRRARCGHAAARSCGGRSRRCEGTDTDGVEIGFDGRSRRCRGCRLGCRGRGVVDVVAEQSPVGPLEQAEQPGGEAARAGHGRVGRAVAGQYTVVALGAGRRQGRVQVAGIELADLAAPVDVAVLRRFEQLFRQAEDGLGDRPALLLIGGQQRFRSTVEYGGELPAEVAGVLDARVEAPSAGRWVAVRRVPGQEYASALVGVGRPGVHLERGRPVHGADHDVVPACAFAEERGEPLGRKVQVAVEGDGGVSWTYWPGARSPVPCWASSRPCGPATMWRNPPAARCASTTPWSGN